MKNANHSMPAGDAFLQDPALIQSKILSFILDKGLQKVHPRLAARMARKWEGGDGYSRSLRRILMEHNGVRVGTYSYGNLMQVTSSPRPGLSIGRYVSMSYTVRWGLPHPLDQISTSPFFYEGEWGVMKTPLWPPSLEICSDAWLGDNVVITGKCARIGFGAAIGAGAIVTSDVPDFAIVTGIPARIRRYRFDEEIRERALAARWWDLSLPELRPWQSQFLSGAGRGVMLQALDEIQKYRKARSSATRID